MSKFQHFRRFCLGLSLPIGGTLSAQAELYQPSSPEPTDDEVAILELMNRYRADPVGEADRILGSGSLPGFFWRGVDRSMFESEVKALKPAPPLVFDLQALLSARHHSHYMIVNNKLGHVQDPSKPGFTGKSFGDRMKFAKFKGSPGGENAFLTTNNPWQSHAGFIIDFGPGGPGGMQKGRGHRMNMISRKFNVVGPSAVPHGSHISVVHNFGRVKKRFVGGAIYSDKNRNGIYDPGEGYADVQLALEKFGKTTATWQSGGFTLEISGEADVLVVKAAGLENRVPLEAGSDNIRLSWAVPPEQARKAADDMSAKVQALEDTERNASKRCVALVNLYMGSLKLDLDQGRQTTIKELTADIAAELKSAQKTYFDAIDANDERQLRTSKRSFKGWRGSKAAEWFTQAELLSRASKGVFGWRSAKEAGREVDQRNVKKLLKALEDAKKKTVFPDLNAKYQALIGEVSAQTDPTLVCLLGASCKRHKGPRLLYYKKRVWRNWQTRKV